MSESKIDGLKTSFVQSALSMLTTSTNHASNSTNNNSQKLKQMEKSPEDIPKEDLVHLCMKMNKRMQAMEIKGQELIKKKASLINDKKLLIDFLRSIPLQIDCSIDNEINLESLNESWSAYVMKQNDYINKLECKVADAEYFLQKEKHDAPNMNDTINGASEAVESSTFPRSELSKLQREKHEIEALNIEIRSKNRKLEMELDRLKFSEISLKNNITTLEQTIHSKSIQVESLNKESEHLKSQMEEKIVFFQMQLNNNKSKSEVAEKEIIELKKQLESSKLQIEEKDIGLQTGKAVHLDLQKQLVAYESEIAQLKEKSRVQMESDATVNSLKNELKETHTSLEESLKRLRDLEEYRVRAEGQLIRMNAQSEKINELTTEVEDKSALIVRMRTEAQTNERNHAMRTALLATTEAQVETLKSEFRLKDDAMKEAVDRVADLQLRLASAEVRLSERSVEALGRIAELEADLSSVKEANHELINSLKRQHEESVEALKKDFLKKSNLARSLIQEKEEENRILSAKVQELQLEISTGAPSERKIFELAKVQAQRENYHGIHSDTREVAFAQLQTTLAERDLDLARLQQLYNDTAAEIGDLRRISRRETVNMDYLKNVVLQYMTFPVHTPERMSLIPVIATLLQFNPKEYTEVERASKDPNWSNRPVKEIKRSLKVASSEQ